MSLDSGAIPNAGTAMDPAEQGRTELGAETLSSPPVSELTSRLNLAAERADAAGVSALLVSPGPDLHYLTGYNPPALERLTCLVVRPGRDPVIVVPELERLAALASPIGSIGLEVATWAEVEDPYELAASLIPQAASVAVDDRMWAVKTFALAEAMPGVRQRAAMEIIAGMREVKSAYEVAALHQAGAAIDAVHREVPDILTEGMTEREAARIIGDKILAAGHARVDFVIVASGPNSASPHHEPDDRPLTAGDAVVVDIGGTMPSGYCSDSTRTYSMGEPNSDLAAFYPALQAAQAAQCAAIRPAMSCSDLDALGRDMLGVDGWDAAFVHRTGHGIGMETHEQPYIVAGNHTPLVPGMAFSIEPGVYLEGRAGARIEDIMVCTEAGSLACNTTPHDLVVIDV